MALSLPNTVESAHMEHPDFRVGVRIFATLGYPDECFGVLMLSPEDQKQWCEAEPEVFIPVKGAWGRGGCTQVNLTLAKKTSVRAALKTAYAERVRKNVRNSPPSAKSQKRNKRKSEESLGKRQS